ncbi:hypothetical protein AGOR_G00019190 [Albula goreensis]|uniref:RPA-related protein RADX n=1 Tax=Albula goreensis TaxID=1534307 RepID=A0A8T3E525_9TELE|nr:hypothetical protein AGOR_G00019190 [Albula goreensis]
MVEDEIPLDQQPNMISSHKSPLYSAFNQLLAAKSLRLKLDNVGFVAVIALQRCLAEQQIVKEKNIDSYCYDVTVTDGIWQVKCHLSSNLNHLVQKNILRSGIDVQITQCSFVYNERRVGLGSVCIERIEVGGEHSHILHSVKDVDAIPVLSKEDRGSVIFVQNDAPLQVSRKHYLSLWDNEDPYGRLWIPCLPPADVVLDVSKMILLCDLESVFGTSHHHLPLLVRIVHKSRLRFYGKLETKIDIPYQAYFEVADQSGSMSMVLWNALCPEWYQRLNVGTVLYLQNYTLKKSYQNRSRPTLPDPKMKTFTSIEIGLNPRNPTAVIDVIPPKSVRPQWGLPDVPYQFISRSELDSLPNNYTCDVIGLVTFVGRCERVRNKGNTVPEKYWTYRWVHIVDGTSDHPFILEIFASSQPEIFSGIYPMTYLVCTQMRVCRQTDTTASYLTSSCETQIYTTGFHKGQPYVSNPAVKSFIQWTKTLKDSVMLKKTVIGGHYCYPPSPPVFTQTIADGTAEVPVVYASELKEALESLQYREHKRMAIQGLITAVQYMPWPEQDQVPEQPAEQVSVSSTSCQQWQAFSRSVLSAPLPGQRISPQGVIQRQVSRKQQQRETLANSDAESANSGRSPRKRRKDTQETRKVKRRYLTRAVVQQERESGKGRTEGEEGEDSEPEEEEDEEEEQPELNPEQSSGHGPQPPTAGLLCTSTPEERQEGDRPSAEWESSAWAALRADLLEHFHFDDLQSESVPRRFSFEDKDYLLQQNNLHPAEWTAHESHPDQNLNSYTPVTCNGYFKITILGINQQTAIDTVFLPVLSHEDPRSIGLPQDAHGNTMLSCLSTGFVGPSGTPRRRTGPPIST